MFQAFAGNCAGFDGNFRIWLMADSSPNRDKLLASSLLSFRYFSRSAVCDRLSIETSTVVHKKVRKSAAGNANPVSFFWVKNVTMKSRITLMIMAQNWHPHKIARGDRGQGSYFLDMYCLI